MKKIHLLAIAGTCRELPGALDCKSPRALIDLIQSAVGPRYRVVGSTRLIDAAEDGRAGGRADDAERARDLTRALADDAVTAIVALRGGAWLARVLPRVDFDVLRRRRTPVTVFGFSELTSVINIAAAYPTARCLYDLGPAFLRSGMTSYARAHVEELGGRTDWEAAAIEAFATGWARGQFRQRFCDFFREVGAIIENRGSPRRITGKLIAGKLPTRPTVTFVGGNLSCLVPLIGSPYRASIETQNKWLVLEEVNEPPHRIDRMLAQLMLAGLLERCAGILVGDFRDDSGDLQEAAVASLRKQLAHWGRTPIVTTRDVGHIWPLAPLPIGRPIALRRAGRTGIGVIQLSVPWTTWSRIDGRAGDQ